MLVRHLLDTRLGDFRITASDQSLAMVEAVAHQSSGAGGVELVVSGIEDMPFSDESFDVVLAMGVLEYADAAGALRELARVVRPGGLVVMTMLNPVSPYRLFEWCIYWPALRAHGRVQGLLGTPAERRYGARRSGIRAVPHSHLRRMLYDVGLCPQEAIYYDLTPLVPPLDKLVRRWKRDWRVNPEKTVGSGVRRWLGTAYLVSAHRPTVRLKTVDDELNLSSHASHHTPLQ
ncbi:class I SAM-dependent methyltransferase [Amycolatopsis marina]